jgi:hypothetical protein
MTVGWRIRPLVVFASNIKKLNMLRNCIVIKVLISLEKYDQNAHMRRAMVDMNGLGLHTM